jgi:hypothetical protein
MISEIKNSMKEKKRKIIWVNKNDKKSYFSISDFGEKDSPEEDPEN